MSENCPKLEPLQIIQINDAATSRTSSAARPLRITSNGHTFSLVHMISIGVFKYQKRYTPRQPAGTEKLSIFQRSVELEGRASLLNVATLVFTSIATCTIRSSVTFILLVPYFYFSNLGRRSTEQKRGMNTWTCGCSSLQRRVSFCLARVFVERG